MVFYPTLLRITKLLCMYIQAYVLDYNIYVYNVTSDELITVTTDGREDVIYNGIPDWLYEGIARG